MPSRTDNQTNTYNGLDTRVSKIDSLGTQTFHRDGAYVTDPVLRDGLANFTPGVSERRAGVTTYSHSGLKSMDGQSNASQVMTSGRTMDAYGNLTVANTTWRGPFGYAGGFGYQTDRDAGLHLLGHRYYDSTTGRFLTRDPIKDGRNWYAYGAGETAPTVIVDPDGLQSMQVGVGGSGASGIVGSSGYVIIEIDKDGDVQIVFQRGFGLGVGAGATFGVRGGWNPAGNVDEKSDSITSVGLSGNLGKGPAGGVRVGMELQKPGEMTRGINLDSPDIRRSGKLGMGIQTSIMADIEFAQEVPIGNWFDWMKKLRGFWDWMVGHF